MIRKVFSCRIHILPAHSHSEKSNIFNSVCGSSCQHQQPATLSSSVAITNQIHRNKRQSNVIYDPTDNRKRRWKTKIHEWKPPNTNENNNHFSIWLHSLCVCFFPIFFFRIVFGAFIIYNVYLSCFIVYASCIHNTQFKDWMVFIVQIINWREYFDKR